MNKTVLTAAVLVVLLVVGWLLIQPQVAAAPERETYRWVLTERSGDATSADTPRTEVALVVGDTTHTVGTYDGSCFVIEESSWTLEPGELSGVICWWAGAGSEVGVFAEGGRIVVKAGVLDEGTAETPGFRGDYRELFVIGP